jgi:hypothetical protein
VSVVQVRPPRWAADASRLTRDLALVGQAIEVGTNALLPALPSQDRL